MINVLNLISDLVIKTNVSSLELKEPYDNHNLFGSGGIFFAIKGHQIDGHSFISNVVQENPHCIIFENESYLSEISKNKNTKYIMVSNSRWALDRCAHLFYGEPSQKLFCVGVTGTSGKTTVSYMVSYLLNNLGIPTGIIGTIEQSFQNKIQKSTTTTPGSLELYKRLNEFVALGAKALSIESSSHAIDQHRMSSLNLDVAIFTNLSRDHLDYHGSAEKYFEAKNKLFSEILKNSKKIEKVAVINDSDPLGKKISVEPNIQRLGYGTNNSEIQYEVLKSDFTGVKFKVRFKNHTEEVFLKSPGKYNILNALAAIGAGVATGKSFSSVARALNGFPGVRGRLQPVENTKNLNIFVDYAHKPDALDNVLKCLVDIKKQTTGSPNIITVFGCGGDRDKGKRPQMAQIAESYSDITIVTSDNPRTEDPEQIINEIMSGFKKADSVKVLKESDRKKAIKKAIELAMPGDVILIAGKGHETYQVIGNKKIDFDDVQVVSSLL